MKKSILTILAILMILVLTGCAKTPDNSVDPMPDPGNNTEIDDPAQTDDPQSESGKVLVVYFSWSGHLHSMAGWIADETGGDLVRVTAKEAYPESYNDTANRAKKEQDDGTRPPINVDLTAEQFVQYDTVYFGFPVWWYDLPMSMWTFLESYDFSGKTVYPFFSHEGSSSGANSLTTLKDLAKGADVRTDVALSIRGGKVDSSEKDVRDWVKGLNK